MDNSILLFVLLAIPISGYACLSAPFQAKGYSNSYPFQDPSLPWAKRVDDLVDRLTLDELINQSIALYNIPTYGVPRLGIKPYVWIAECLRGEVNTLGTAFPQALGLAATFSDNLLHDVAEAVSYEVRAHWNNATKDGTHFPPYGISCFSPVINIMRHPLWGRNQETYGEDPYLTSVMAQGFVTGLQGAHPRYVRASAGCKHLDVYGGPENIPTLRYSFNANVTNRDWQMTFLPAFQACIDAGVYSIGCSYNSINGVPACANAQLLNTITRKQMGFRGYVFSDASALAFLYDTFHYVPDALHAAALGVKAGCNLELGSNTYLQLPKAVQLGLVTEDVIRESVKPLMYTRMRLGEFDPPSMNPYTSINMSIVQSPAHQKLAITAAMKSFVLLKNVMQTLPLVKRYKKVAIVGPMSNNPLQLFGDYAAKVNAQTKTPWQGLAPSADQAVMAEGCPSTSCPTYNVSDIKEKVTGSDLVIICLGTGQSLEAESRDRSSLDLPGQQLDILQTAAIIGSKQGAAVIVLLFNAGPLDVTWAKLSPHVHVMVECFLPAQATGDALYRTLLAKTPDAVPAGRLPATWPAYLAQVPPITDYAMEGHTYRYYEGTPLYPFGYGLSYTTFSYSDLSINPQIVRAGRDVAVSVTLTNTGQYDADEVVQVYLKWPPTISAAPKLQLVGFRRVPTRHGLAVPLDFVIRGDQMAVWVNDTEGMKVLPGTMTVYVGGQQPDQETSVPSNVLKGQFVII